MAKRTEVTPEMHHRIQELKKKNKMKNADIATTIAKEFGVKAPSPPTISKKLNSKAPKLISNGEKLLQEAQKNPQTIAKKPIPEINQQSLDASLDREIDLSKFSNFGDSNLGSLSQMANTLVNESVNEGSIFDSIPQSNETLDYSGDGIQYADEGVSVANYKNDDVSTRFQEGYQQKLSEPYEDTNFMNESSIANIQNGNGITLSNETRLYIEKLLKTPAFSGSNVAQIYACGFILGNNIYFPSFNFGYLFEIQNGANVKDGFVIVVNNTIHIVTEEVIKDKISDNIVAGIINFKKWMFENFNNFDLNNRKLITYDAIISRVGEDQKSIAYVGLINQLKSKNELKQIISIPKNDNNGNYMLDVIVTVTNHNMSVLSFIV